MKRHFTYLLPAFLLLTGCVVRPNGDAAAFGKGDQYLRYGVEAFAAGQPAVARARFNWALGVFAKNGNLDGQLRAHINLAELALQTHDISGAAAHISRAEALAVPIGETGYLRRMLLIESGIALKRGDHDEALEVLTELLGEHAAAAVDKPADAIHTVALVNRAALSQDRNAADFGDWVRELKRSLVASGGRSEILEARLLRFEAELYRRSGDFGSADAAFSSALTSCEAVPFGGGAGSVLREWAQLDIERGRWAEASGKLRRAVVLEDQAGDREAVIAGLRLLMQVEGEQGSADEVEALRQLVLGLSKEQAPADSRLHDLMDLPRFAD